MTFRADGHLLRDPAGRELLGGPVEEIAAFAVALNARPPATEAQLRHTLVDLIEGTTDCAFAPFIPLDDEAAAEMAAAAAECRARVRASEMQFAQGRLL